MEKEAFVDFGQKPLRLVLQHGGQAFHYTLILNSRGWHGSDDRVVASRWSLLRIAPQGVLFYRY